MAGAIGDWGFGVGDSGRMGWQNQPFRRDKSGYAGGVQGMH